MQPLPADTPRYVHVSDEYDAVAAAWRRLGFEPVPGWSRGLRSTLFRAGPAFVELVDAGALRARDERAYAAAVALSGR
jgi:hypothetical protein